MIWHLSMIQLNWDCIVWHMCCVLGKWYWNMRISRNMKTNRSEYLDVPEARYSWSNKDIWQKGNIFTHLAKRRNWYFKVHGIWYYHNSVQYRVKTRGFLLANYQGKQTSSNYSQNQTYLIYVLCFPCFVSQKPLDGWKPMARLIKICLSINRIFRIYFCILQFCQV